MHSTISTLALSLLLPLTLAKNIPITVGADAKLLFNPPNVVAAPGDTLTFSYFPRNHSVTQSSFADPCRPLAGGFNSGFQPLAAGPGPVQFVVPVNDTKPIWVYCAQTTGRHCQMGMSMVVNEPAPPSPNTLDAYRLAAANTGNSTAAPFVAGGQFVSLNSTMPSGPNASASGTASGGVAFPTGSGTDGSSNGGSTGSDGAPVSFQGASVKFASGLTVMLAAPGIVACALV